MQDSAGVVLTTVFCVSEIFNLLWKKPTTLWILAVARSKTRIIHTLANWAAPKSVWPQLCCLNVMFFVRLLNESGFLYNSKRLDMNSWASVCKLSEMPLCRGKWSSFKIPLVGENGVKQSRMWLSVSQSREPFYLNHLEKSQMLATNSYYTYYNVVWYYHYRTFYWVPLSATSWYPGKAVPCVNLRLKHMTFQGRGKG